MAENNVDEKIVLEYEDMQGLIMRGYGDLTAAYFVLLHIPRGEEAVAKAWLKSIAPRITNAVSQENRTEALHIAFTRRGLRRLGLGDDVQFACEFEDEMTSRHKRRILGDHGDSAPETWQWGAPGEDKPDVHILLMLYAKDDEEQTTNLDALYNSFAQTYETTGLHELARLSTRTLIERKEHFCFNDGFSQPVIGGTSLAESLEGTAAEDEVLAPGEFILGYKNAYGKLPDSPGISPRLDPKDRLEKHDEFEQLRDLGRNGTYLVFRTLKQNVYKFWHFLDEATGGDAARRDRIAAKMVGRWRSGVSLIQAPDSDPFPDIEPANDFLYCIGYKDFDPDPIGTVCPIGSHVRRSNPRDSVFPGSEDIVTDSNKHRILRRGRSYGEPASQIMDPQEIVDSEDDDVERGLHFICLNTDIGRQFEFVQHTWINNPRFANMYDELDPLVGDYGDRHRIHASDSAEPEPESTPASDAAEPEKKKSITGAFSIPGDPVRERITGLTRYVEVRGGAYFFMPGLKALQVIAELP